MKSSDPPYDAVVVDRDAQRCPFCQGLVVAVGPEELGHTYPLCPTWKRMSGAEFREALKVVAS